MDVELQQRALEYSVIFTNFDNMRESLLEAMPPYEKIDDEEEGNENVDSGTESNLIGGFDGKTENENSKKQASDDLLGLVMDSAPSQPAAAPATNPNQNILDMLDLSKTSASAAAAPVASSSNDILDMLGGATSTPSTVTPSTPQNNDLNDLLGMGTTTVTSTATTTPSSANTVDDLLGSLGGGSGEPKAASEPAAVTNVGPLECFKNDNFKVQVKYEKESPKVAKILTRLTHLSGPPMNNFTFQVAVPKSQQVQMLEANSKVLSSESTFINQIFRVNNPNQEVLRFRFRFVWVDESGEEKTEIGVGEGIPDAWR